jgi:hypothetical protein
VVLKKRKGPGWHRGEKYFVTDRHKNTSRVGVKAKSGEWLKLTERERSCLEAVREDVEAYRALQFFCKKTGRTEESWIVTFVINAWSSHVLADQNPGEISPATMKQMAETAEI